mgnify:CR=1 FL=1
MTKRGRPKNRELVIIKSLFPDVTSRQGLYDKLYFARVCVAAGKLGLIDSDGRCLKTGCIMLTKMSMLGRVFSDVTDWHQDPWASWLAENWEAIAKLKASECKRVLTAAKKMMESEEEDESE